MDRDIGREAPEEKSTSYCQMGTYNICLQADCVLCVKCLQFFSSRINKENEQLEAINTISRKKTWSDAKCKSIRDANSHYHTFRFDLNLWEKIVHQRMSEKIQTTWSVITAQCQHYEITEYSAETADGQYHRDFNTRNFIESLQTFADSLQTVRKEKVCVVMHLNM